MTHQSIITIDVYVEYSLEQLEINSPSSVKSNNNCENLYYYKKTILIFLF